MFLLPAPTPIEAAAINVLSKYHDWATVVGYLDRAQREGDVKLRACTPDHLGKLQGCSLTLLDIVALPDASREVLKQRT